MRTLGLSLVLLLGSACGSVEYKWVGTCDFGDARYGYSSAVTLDMVDGSGSSIQGELELIMHDGRELIGKLDGLRSDTYLELEGDIRKNGVYTVSMSGDIDDTVIEGDCGIELPLSTGALTGELLLER